MAARRKVKPKEDEETNDYFAPEGRANFFHSGCTLLDCVLGGGWPLGRVSNVVGDKAVGKTLLAIEAAANFSIQYPKGVVWYREAEAAFDEHYAATLGLPLDRVDFGSEGIGTQWDTIEDIFEDLSLCIRSAKDEKRPGLYIVDSLDALSSRAELERPIEAGSFKLEKQKVLGELFRRMTRALRDADIHVMIISQVRDKIGVVFGEKHTRSGGKALDFYASQILWLSNLGVISKQKKGAKRPVAVRVKAKCKKNKIGLPFRECEFVIRFGYGIEDLLANLEWLGEVKKLDKLGLTKDTVDKWFAETEALPKPDYDKRCEAVRAGVREAWEEIEAEFLPKRRKYE